MLYERKNSAYYANKSYCSVQQSRYDIILHVYQRFFVSPFSLRCLLTVAAAIRFADFTARPLFIRDFFIFSYCLVLFLLFTPFNGMFSPLSLYFLRRMMRVQT